MIQIDQKRKAVDEYIIDFRNGFETNCEEFVLENLYYNLKEHDEWYTEAEMSFEEFKEDDDIISFCEMACRR